MSDEYERDERDGDEGWRRALPWVVLAVVIAIVFWLIWLYGDWGRGGNTVSETQGGGLVSVPNLLGMDGEDATALLTESGLLAEEGVSYDANSDPGTVASQLPEPGTRVKPGTSVYIGVVDITVKPRDVDAELEPDYQGEAKGITSRPPKAVKMVVVPSVNGLSEADAVARIKAAGLVARPMYQPRESRLGLVEQQVPEAGEEIPVGTQVHILIAVARH